MGHFKSGSVVMRGISSLQPRSLGCFHGLLAENEMEEEWRVNTGNIIIQYITTTDMILLGLNVQSELIKLRLDCLGFIVFPMCLCRVSCSTFACS